MLRRDDLRAIISPCLAGFLPRPAAAPGQDEYSDDEDPGYWREPVRRQDAFVLTELKHSDDESSPIRRAYHRWPCPIQFSALTVQTGRAVHMLIPQP